jgi:release factor glutamine methyltransferase
MAYKPDLSHMTAKDYREVYPPSEDTYLLIDALLSDVNSVQARMPGVVAEMCVGSGAVLTSVLNHLPGADYVGLAIDIAPRALQLAGATLRQNGNAPVELL